MHSQAQGLKAGRFQARVKLAPPSYHDPSALVGALLAHNGIERLESLPGECRRGNNLPILVKKALYIARQVHFGDERYLHREELSRSSGNVGGAGNAERRVILPRVPQLRKRPEKQLAPVVRDLPPSFLARQRLHDRPAGNAKLLLINLLISRGLTTSANDTAAHTHLHRRGGSERSI